MFGSVARGDDRPDSDDVDFLYVPTPDNELGWEFYRLGDELAVRPARTRGRHRAEGAPALGDA